MENNKELSKMTLEELNDYSLELNNEYEDLQKEIRWAKFWTEENKHFYTDCRDKTIKEKLINISNIVNERYARYKIMYCSKKLKKLEKLIDEFETFLNSR